ncbi:MAG: glycosyltransferase family 2 protein [Lachnospiraceae bacterium]|nr:glycosyltransferase family 2 protein [Lachnospiraceae bacterium]
MKTIKKEPYISVVIVNYNYAHLITRALDAVKEQSFSDYEIVVVNNGSTDNSDDVIRDYIDNNKELQIITTKVEKNIGLFKGRNAALNIANGKYILFNDADDWMKPNCLNILASIAEKENADKVCSAFTEIDAEGNQLRDVTYCKNQSKWFATSMQATLFRRSIIMENGIRFHDSWLDDIDFNTHFNYFSRKEYYTNTSTYFYFVNEMSTSGAKVKNRGWTYLDLQRDMLSLFVPMIEKLEGKDKEDLYYLMIKQYYFYMLHSNRYSTWPEMKRYYAEAHKMMLLFMPDYLKGQRVKLFKDNGDRVTGRRLTWCFYTAEKIRLFKAVLYIFLFASRFQYLNP